MQPVLICARFWIRRHCPKIARFKTCRPHFSGPVDLQLILHSQTEVRCHSHTLSCRWLAGPLSVGGYTCTIDLVRWLLDGFDTGGRGLGRREKRTKLLRLNLGGILVTITQSSGNLPRLEGQLWLAAFLRSRTDLSLHLT